MESKWIIQTLTKEQEDISRELADKLKISHVSADMLARRGILTAEEARMFIRPDMQRLHNPFLLKDMDKAVSRLSEAIDKQERILVYGDYDVDGTTATALVYKFLRGIHSNLDFYIPDRYTEGYGVSNAGVDYAAETGCNLIIALDCGIKDAEQVAYAAEKGIDFIICDHHLPDETLPQAVAVVDAKRKDCTYPDKGLSGCGVGYKLLQAYCLYKNIPLEQLNSSLELLALSIACDIVPMRGENRILAYYGLRQLNVRPSVGIKCLLDISKVEQGKVNISDLGFKIGPRINASGRIKSGKDAVRLLITDDLQEAKNIAEAINDYNDDRRNKEEEIVKEAKALLEADENNSQKKATVVCGKDWLKGVVGIVASRLIDSYYRPTIVLSESDGMASGSARSVGGFDIYAAIDSCSDLLSSFGGHVYAAGLSMKSENVPAFKQRFEQYVAEHILPEQCFPTIQVESEISFADINNKFLRIIDCLEPFGPGNPRPVFVTRDVCNYRYTKTVGKQQEHLRLDVTDRTGYMQGIAFGKGDLAVHLQNGENVDLCYELGQNTYNGYTTTQMMVKDIKLIKSNN